jgi:Kef-type K+ transport system membrane component KefB
MFPAYSLGWKSLGPEAKTPERPGIPGSGPLKGLTAGALAFLLVSPGTAFASAADACDVNLLSSISLCILAATALAYVASLIKTPLLLAYLAAGFLIGPHGFGWVQGRGNIETIAEIGLILLLFMIGLELNLKKVREAGVALIATGILQFLLCAALGFGFFLLLGFTMQGLGAVEYHVLGIAVRGGSFDLLYLTMCLALSSTAIVVKLLYEKFELDTLAGRLTLGVLVFQDLWAVIILGLQPNLTDPRVLAILWSFVKLAGLVALSLLLSRYVLGWLFHRIAKLPELMLVASLGWCFFICGLGGYAGLSWEMGALIAGIAISTFPYNLDIIAKIVSIRDFFLILFFVALGMLIPNPLKNLGLILIAVVASVFLTATRFLTVAPLLHALKQGNRVALLTSLNLSQLSEFALVITAIGMKPEYRHVGGDVPIIILFTFALTAISSTYLIKYSQPLAEAMSRVLESVGLQGVGQDAARPQEEAPKEIAILGFFRTASALVAKMEELGLAMTENLVVVDFNPEVYRQLNDRGIQVVYGDISNLHTLHHAGVDQVKLVVSTVPDEILVGTSNVNLTRQMKQLCPQAAVIVTAESAARALKMYEAGADYVVLPHQLTAMHLIPLMQRFLRGEAGSLKKQEIRNLKGQEEILT